MKKNFMDFFNSSDADIFCVQETKMQKGQAEFDFKGYNEYWNSAEKKGYSGTAIFSKSEPVNVMYGMGIPEHDLEGRVITLEFNNFYLINIYTPNSKRELERLSYRMEWEGAFLSYISRLDKLKPLIFCGDLNVAHKEIDLKNPKSNTKNAGFTKEERTKFQTLLDSGFVDTYRYINPDAVGKYTWWSYIRNARATNAGWRIDYFITSERLKQNITDVVIYDTIYGSDHCPVGLGIDI
jgi:exodeoxyribonuclease-3